MIFWKWELCHACAARTREEISCFLELEVIKIYLIGSNLSNIENRHKVLNHSTLFQMEWGAKKEGHSLITFIPLFWSDQTANSVSPFHLLTALFFVYIESYFLNPPLECKVLNFSFKHQINKIWKILFLHVCYINNFPNFVSSAKGEFPYDANCWSSL